jgi:transcriptional regulator with XRE-family HTH domain
MSEDPSVTGGSAGPGNILKALRTQNHWTLAYVSSRTGMTVSTLSKIENGKTALTFEKLVRLSEGLNVDVAQLFGAAAEDNGPVDGATRRSVTRAGEGRTIEADGGRYIYVATDLLHKRMIPIIGEVWRRDVTEYDEFLHHEGEEFVYVLEGVLELHTALYTPIRLEVGDSVYFDSGMKHAYVSVGDGPCRILSMCATSEQKILDLLDRRGGRAAPAAPPKVIRREKATAES